MTFVLVLAAAAFLALTHGSEVVLVFSAAREASPVWLALAVVLQIGYYAGYIATFRLGMRAAGVRRSMASLAPVMLASLFVNTVTPSAGIAGPALIVDDAVRDGHDSGAATAGVLVGQVADLTGFGVIMVVGFSYLLAAGRLTALETLAAAAFLGLIALGAAAVIAAARWPRAVELPLLAAERATTTVAGWLRRPPGAPWASRVAEELSAAVRLSVRSRGTLVRAWVVAVLGHALDLGCFAAVAWAFGVREPGAMLAGYAVGTVVWLTSLVPNGVGLVEGSVALLLATFGVPPAIAAAISLTFRGLTFWLPFALGFLALPRLRSFREEPGPLASELPARAAAVLVFSVGLVNILSASTPALAARVRVLESVLPLGVTAGNLAAALAGVALLYLARGLWRHKRAAYVLTLVVLGVSVVSHLLKGLDYEEAVLDISVGVWLLTEARAFYARPDGPSLRQGLRALAGASIVTLAYGAVGFWLLDRHFSANFGARAAIRQTVVMFTQFYDPGLEPIIGFGRYFAESVYVIGAATAAYALLMLLRPVVVRHPASAPERARAAAIVREHGRSSIAALTLLPDKSLWFSAGGSVVAFAVSGGVAVTLGDPIGPEDDLAASTIAFARFAEKNGWIPAFYETNEPDRPGYRDAGYSAVCIGYEAIVRVKEFDLSGKSHKSLRNKVNRFTDDGYTVKLLPAPQPQRVLDALRRVSDAWLAESKGAEKHFSLGWFDERYIGSSDVMVVRSPVGAIIAFGNLISEYRLNEATIDLMRHLPDAPSGVMDFLFVELFRWSAQQGYDTFNMGLSPLAGLGEDPEHGITERLLSLIYEHGNALYGFRGLHDYKEKFDPVWEPRYLIYPDAASLPAVFAAVVRVNSGEHPWREYLDRILNAARHDEPVAASP